MDCPFDVIYMWAAYVVKSLGQSRTQRTVKPTQLTAYFIVLVFSINYLTFTFDMNSLAIYSNEIVKYSTDR